MILKIFLYPLTLPLFFSLTLASAVAQDINGLKAGVVRITSNKSGEVGTGFIIKIKKDRIYIVTSSHVVRGNEYPEVYLYNRPLDPLPATILDKEEDDLKGFALLTLNSKDIDLSSLAALSFRDTFELNGGEDIKIIGFPNSTTIWTVTGSTVARLEGRNVAFSGTIHQGNSGGPVILNGQVIGLVTDVSQGLAYAARAESVVAYANGIDRDLIAPIKARDSSAPGPVAPASNAPVKKDRAQYKRWSQLIMNGVEGKDAHVLIEELSKELKLVPNNVYALRMRAFIYNTQRLNSLRNNDAETGIQLLTEPVTAEDFETRCYFLDSLDRLTEAMVNCDKAIQIQPQFALAFYSRSSVFYNQKKFDLFWADITTAIANKSDFVLAYSTRGSVWLVNRTYDQAIKDFSSAIVLKPNNPVYYKLRGLAHFMSNKIQEALNDFNKAIELDPGNRIYLIDRAEAYEKLGQNDLAEADRKKAKELELAKP